MSKKANLQRAVVHPLKATVTVIDYGVGNLRSVTKALE
ncbi:MAG: hypothetical protein RJAPGHWK_002540, partial [Candidatus Fervidibacter sp.]